MSQKAVYCSIYIEYIDDIRVFVSEIDERWLPKRQNDGVLRGHVLLGETRVVPVERGGRSSMVENKNT